MNDMQAMILEIQQVGFVLVDLNLYLDTHPGDGVALANYNTLSKQYQDMMMNYNMKYGPIVNFGHQMGGTDSFLWVNSPWPWQKDANTAFYRR
jgi:spore coat protein JB